MIVFDVEADNLLEDATKIHCLSYTADGSKPVTLVNYDEMRKLLSTQQGLIGHNIVGYDKPLLEKLLGIQINARLFDTLPMSWVLNHSRSKHGLDSFGEEFGIPKPVVTDWSEQSIEVYKHRCEEDVKINWMLWQNLLRRFKLIYKDDVLLDKFFRYLQFKMDCAVAAENTGWRLNKTLAQSSRDTLVNQQETKVEELKTVMPRVEKKTTKRKPKKCFKEDGSASALGTKWFELLKTNNLPPHYDGEISVHKSWKEPNPNSPEQVKDWLYSLGWNPCTHNYVKEDDGSERPVPQVRKDGELTDSVKLLVRNNNVVGILDGLTVIQHRLAIFNGFIECERNGYVKAQIAGLTNTLRFKHKKPLVNLPGVDKPWGKEVRGCLIADEGTYLCGSDMTSLEDTTKRHYMKPYDPDYVEEMAKKGFDPHLDLAKHAGAVTQRQIDDHNLGKISLKSLRKNYKVVNYSATYGVGAAKLSRTTGMTIPQSAKLLKAYWERNWAVKAFSEAQKIRTINGEMWVQNPVSKFWHSLRYEKDVFSTINQSTGAYCFDKWVAYYRTKRPNILGQFHDETINQVKIGMEQEHTTILMWAIDKVNQELKLNVDLGIDVQYGNTYSEIH
tara:strand:- start:2611 stop:4452 length:1842 start_codon:yes stop_codon:yes gene_type:complete